MLAPKETNEDLALPDDACPVLNAGEEKEVGMQGLEKKNNSVNVVEVVDGCWQRPPFDIMENIVQRLNLHDRIRLSILCKYWRMIVMQIIRSAPPFPCYLVENTVKNSKSGHVVTRTLHRGDGDELELKLVYDKEKSRKGSFNCWGEGDFLDVKVKDESYLIESTTSNEVLLIRQIKDQMKTDLNTWTRTHDFLVYKIDSENGESFIEVQSLGNQILFVTSRGCSFSFPVSNSNRLEANCIYFAELGGIDHDDMFCVENSGHGKTTMCDFSHPFYLDGRKFGRSNKFYDSIETEFTWGVSWYSPSLQ